MKGLIFALFLPLILISCGNLPQDKAAAPIEEGQKRVETIICDRHDVGENGCVFTDGQISSSLKIYKIYAGSVEILGAGCGVNYKTNYSASGSEWLEIDLKSLIGSDHLGNDCVLTIVQKVVWEDQDKLTFPIKSFFGTVTLGTCPLGVNCSFDSYQYPLTGMVGSLKFDLDDDTEGKFYLAGCGKELIPLTDFKGDLRVPVSPYLPAVKNSGCLFIMAVIYEQELFKTYTKVWRYSDKVIQLARPSLEKKSKKICFTGDASTFASKVNNKLSSKNKACFSPSGEGDYVRFYTSQGRSLITFIKDGEIKWAK